MDPKTKKLIEDAVAAEREACARLVESGLASPLPNPSASPTENARLIRTQIAASIRARSTMPQGLDDGGS